MAEAAIVHSWQVGHRIVTLSLPRTLRGVVHGTVEWEPDFPGFHLLSAAERREYDAGMAVAQQLAREAQQEGR